MTNASTLSEKKPPLGFNPEKRFNIPIRKHQRNLFQNLFSLGTNGIRYTGLNGPLAEFLELDKKSGVVTLGKDLFTNGQNTSTDFIFRKSLWSQLHQGHRSVRPKFGIGRKYRPKLWVSVSVSEPKLFFPKPKLFLFFFSKFFQIFSFISAF